MTEKGGDQKPDPRALFKGVHLTGNAPPPAPHLRLRPGDQGRALTSARRSHREWSGGFFWRRFPVWTAFRASVALASHGHRFISLSHLPGWRGGLLRVP